MEDVSGKLKKETYPLGTVAFLRSVRSGCQKYKDQNVSNPPETMRFRNNYHPDLLIAELLRRVNRSTDEDCGKRAVVDSCSLKSYNLLAKSGIHIQF
jgi:hypothetical protein